MVSHERKTSKPLLFGLSLAAGLGFLLMLVALAVGMVQGTNANITVQSVTFFVGLGLFLFGVIAWFVTVRPDLHFDDINEPMYHGHHDHDEHDEHAHESEDDHTHA